MICFLLLAALPASSLADYIRIKGTVVNVRQGPGTSHAVLFQAEQGEEFDLVSTEGLWCRIRILEDQEAWVFLRLVDIVKGSRPGAAAAMKAQEEKPAAPSLWSRISLPVAIFFSIFLAAVGVWKRREILRFMERKLKEISGYKRDQAFRYDNRKPSDDSWEL